MEESKELQGFYKIFRAVVYISVLMEFFEYAIDPAVLDHWGGILIDIHGRIKRWMIYNDGNLVYSKVATVLLICITCAVSARERLRAAGAVGMAVRPSDGNAAVHAAAEHHFLHGRLPRGCHSRAYRAGQHIEVPQGGSDERPLQFGK